MLTSPIQVECSAGNQLERKRSESLGLRWSEQKVSSPRIRLGNSSLVKGLLCFPPCNRSAGWFELGGDEINSINWLKELRAGTGGRNAQQTAPDCHSQAIFRIFEVRQLKCALRWYVRVLWSYGQEQYVNGFTSVGSLCLTSSMCMIWHSSGRTV